MSSVYLEELMENPGDPVKAVRALAQIADALERHRAFLQQLADRLLIVDELPESAPFGALIRLRTGTVAERAPLYLGNGDDKPLTKLDPTLVT